MSMREYFHELTIVHVRQVEKEVLMAVLYGHSTKDMHIEESSWGEIDSESGNPMLRTSIYGKGGVLIKRIDTSIRIG